MERSTVMLEPGTYGRAELFAILGAKDKTALERKMTRYSIDFTSSGRGNNLVYEIKKLRDPFKVFAILELGCDGNTDFRKLRLFYYHYFNDDYFMAMPDEVKETMLRKEDKTLSRQTIAKYTQRLVFHNLIERNTSEYIYYFAYKDTQRQTEKAEYSQAWREYWADRHNGIDSMTAIFRMRAAYGGVARKQAIPEINGIYNEKIEQLKIYIQQSIENEIQE